VPIDAWYHERAEYGNYIKPAFRFDLTLVECV
jgi:hypothetical protein